MGFTGRATVRPSRKTKGPMWAGLRWPAMTLVNKIWIKHWRLLCQRPFYFCPRISFKLVRSSLVTEGLEVVVSTSDPMRLYLQPRNLSSDHQQTLTIKRTQAERWVPLEGIGLEDCYWSSPKGTSADSSGSRCTSAGCHSWSDLVIVKPWSSWKNFNRTIKMA